ncbi:hypothetical protein [Altererythrobacter sp. GH1-8]|uniref:hypothetical protein n=1 Tax=Altererythrobacter sp. GH1-8 TaxID=3349333 RepID=UPI00374D0079
MNEFTTVSECVKSFKSFLGEPIWRDGLQSDLTVLGIMLKELSELRELTNCDSRTEFRKLCKDTLNQWMELARCNNIAVPELSKEDFLSDFRKQIDNFRDELFSEHLPNYLKVTLENYLYEYLIREGCKSGTETGVVIAGFGSDEYHPQVFEFFVDGRYKEHVRVWDGRISNFADDPAHPSQIMAFAQKDMTNLFMEGLSPAYFGYVKGIVNELLQRRMDDVLANFDGTPAEKLVEKKLQEKTNDEIYDRIGNDLKSFRDRFFIQPLMANVRSLPREEMAAMAEALVELTSLRRKIDSTLQSVAGPVDVVFISKADGVVWIKRKHYFDPDLNREFLQRSKIRGERD